MKAEESNHHETSTGISFQPLRTASSPIHRLSRLQDVGDETEEGCETSARGSNGLVGTVGGDGRGGSRASGHWGRGRSVGRSVGSGWWRSGSGGVVDWWGRSVGGRSWGRSRAIRQLANVAQLILGVALPGGARGDD